MRRGARHLLVGLVATTLGLGGTLTAFADWAVPSTVTVKARAAKMPRGVQPSVAKQGKTAVVSWSAQQLAPDAGMDEYVITAHSLNAPPLPDITHVVAATGGPSESVTFSAAEVAGGTWQWTITPGFRHWVGNESKKSSRLTFATAPAATKTAATGTDAATTDPAPRVEPPTPTDVTSPAAPKPTTDPAPTLEPPPALEPTEDATSAPPEPASEKPLSPDPAESDLTD
ncbi:hypothetical protein HH310_04615 [Actinoplanes sp. TBRC 11911]|uniref:hypothetical protein n=1 Tax=Actinoplanes sp. TBRC 11911 TaxID=2729386 RepID=UPI00145C84C8|nr:hypothetical protein [Actinoplanes sp. TBRC 11911]NMO50475.1 hypothetical protein [Actinoplanes sp. TBRC 11911]